MNKEHFNFTKRRNLGRFFKRNNLFLTGSARDYGYLYNQINQLKDMVIYFPSYICNSVFDNISELENKIVFYNITLDLKIASDQLYSTLSSDPKRRKALYVVHYFGFPDPKFEEISQFCKQHGIMLFEDCALSLYSRYKGKYLGSLGDVGIYNLTKNTCLLDGGAVIFNGNKINDSEIEVFSRNNPDLMHPHYLRIVKSIIRKLLIKYFNQNVVSYVLKYISRNGDHSIKKINQSSNRHSISLLSKSLLKYCDEEIIRSHHLNNYKYMQNNFDRNLTFDWMRLQPGILPHTFSLKVHNKNKIIPYLRARGIHVINMWDEKLLPLTMINNADMENTVLKISRSFISIPIHLGIKTKDLSKLVNIIHNFDIKV